MQTQHTGPVSETVQNALLSLGVVAFAVNCVYLAFIPRATGFENSLISAYPPGFWLAFTVGLIVVILVFIGSTLMESDHWRPAFGLLAAFYGIFFFLPLHRGYRLYGRGSSDALAHLGIVKAVLSQGTIDVPALFYPLEHLVIAELSIVGVDPTTTRYLLPLVFTLFFIGSVGILVRVLVGSDRAIGAGLCAAVPLVFTFHQVNINPFLLSFMLFPLVLFAIERSQRTDDWRYSVTYTLMGLGIIFFHPMTTLFFLIIVVSIILLKRSYARNDPQTTARPTTHLPALLGILMAWWYIPFERTQRAVASVVASFDGGQETLAADQVQAAQAVEFTLLELAQRLVVKYGVVFIFLGVAGLYALSVLYRLYREDAWYPEVFATSQYIIGGILTVVFLTIYLIAFDPVRVSRYLILGAVLLFALLLVRACVSWQRSSESALLSRRRLVLPVLILCVITAAVLGSYAGTTYWPNKQMTHAEYHGSEFVVTHSDPSVRVHGHSLHVKMQWFITGTRSQPGNPPVLRSGANHSVPKHLGYDTNRTAGRTFGRANVVTQAYDVEHSRATYFTPEQQRRLFVYGEDALGQLERDTTAGRVYTNGEFTVWNVSPEQELTEDQVEG